MTDFKHLSDSVKALDAAAEELAEKLTDIRRLVNNIELIEQVKQPYMYPRRWKQAREVWLQLLATSPEITPSIFNPSRGFSWPQLPFGWTQVHTTFREHRTDPRGMKWGTTKFEEMIYWHRSDPTEEYGRINDEVPSGRWFDERPRS